MPRLLGCSNRTFANKVLCNKQAKFHRQTQVHLAHPVGEKSKSPRTAPLFFRSIRFERVFRGAQKGARGQRSEFKTLSVIAGDPATGVPSIPHTTGDAGSEEDFEALVYVALAEREFTGQAAIHICRSGQVNMETTYCTLVGEPTGNYFVF